MEDENVAARLKAFMDSEELTSSQFADTCGIPRPSLSQFLSGRNKKLSTTLVKLIHEKFPRLNVLWLMFGEGEMLTPEPLNPALASEAAKFMENEANIEPDSNLKGFNNDIFASNAPINPSVNLHEATSQKPKQIEKIEVKLRKVKSITIFYDDNSYEIFYPDTMQNKK